MNLVETLRSCRSAWSHPEADRRPGVVVIVCTGDGVAIDASGLADLEMGVPMTTATRLYAASLAKPVTGLCVHRLVEEGRLDLDEPVDRWFPALADGSRITLRHLLLHRSGLPEYHALRLLAGFEVDDPLDHGDVLRLVDGMPTWFAPGERVSYNNTNFAMLAHVVAAVTGMPFPHAAAELVFRPAGMATATVRAASGDRVDAAAEGYTRDGEGFHRVTMGAASMGDGGMWWSGNDLAAFGRALLGGGLPTATGTDSCVRRLRQQLPLPDGSVPELAHGCLVSRDGWFGALAEFTGFRAELRVHAADGVALGAMTNQQDAPIAALLDSISSALGLPARVPPAVPAPTAGPLPSGVLVGVGGAPWRFSPVPADGAGPAATVEVGTLRFEIEATAGTTVGWHVVGRPAMRVTWEGGEVVVRDGAREVARLRPVGGAVPGPDRLAAVTGDWWCPAAEASLVVEPQDAALVLRRGRQAPEPLSPAGDRGGRVVLAAPWGLLELDPVTGTGSVVLHRAEGLPLVHRPATGDGSA